MRNMSVKRFGPSIKKSLRNLGHRLGVEFHRHSLNTSEDLRLVHFLQLQKVNVVLDVGANIGQFGTRLIEAGYNGKVVSFEAFPIAHEALVEAAAPHANWTVAARVALSESKGTATFYVTEGSACSSLLRPLHPLVEATPAARIRERIEVATERLDSFTSSLNLSGCPALLKMDVQGGEAMVLGGATGLLPYIKGILLELTLTELYDGQPTALDLHRQITGLGFELWDIWPGYRNPQTLRLNQIDALYFSP